jgi:lactate dehydrogenase-like 2-hydroxyacid dehydrogenase
MKLGIIGVGAVGSATAMAAASRARVREIVLIDRDQARAKAVAIDMHYGVALSPLFRSATATTPSLPMPASRSSPPASMKRPAAPPTAATRPAACACSTPT